jgi:hypothetical protein
VSGLPSRPKHARKHDHMQDSSDQRARTSPSTATRTRCAYRTNTPTSDQRKGSRWARLGPTMRESVRSRSPSNDRAAPILLDAAESGTIPSGMYSDGCQTSPGNALAKASRWHPVPLATSTANGLVTCTPAMICFSFRVMGPAEEKLHGAGQQRSMSNTAVGFSVRVHL